MFSLLILPKKVRLIIYNNKFKTFSLITLPPSLNFLTRKTSYIYMFKYPLGDCVSKENNVYVGLTTTTLSRRLTMHLNDSSLRS